jgi:sugar phosphate isomerase/epimerase
MKLALFSKIFDGRPLETAIDLTAELGYDGIEIMARTPHLPPDTSLERAEELSERLDRAGLAVPCLATYTGFYDGLTDDEAETQLAEFERYAELGEVLDCDLIRHKPGGPPLRDATDDDFERAAGYLRRAADVAAEYDRTVGVEIHAGRLVETAESTARFLDLVDRDNVSVIHDAGNMHIVDADYGSESVERLGESLVHVHVKDLRRIDDPSAEGAFELETNRGEEIFQHCLLGEGDVNYRPLAAELAEIGYDGYLTDECAVASQDGDNIEVAKHELTALENLTDEVRSTAD